MNLYNFQKSIDRLGRNFKSQYSTEQIAHLFERLKSLSELELHKTVDRLIDRCPRLPTIADVVTEARDSVRMVKQELVKRTGPCKVCFGTGIRSGRLVDASKGVAPYAFRCNECNSAEMAGLSKLIPYWQPDYNSDIQMETFTKSIVSTINEQTNEKLPNQTEMLLPGASVGLPDVPPFE